jgi:hypothetical protein
LVNKTEELEGIFLESNQINCKAAWRLKARNCRIKFITVPFPPGAGDVTHEKANQQLKKAQPLPVSATEPAAYLRKQSRLNS